MRSAAVQGAMLDKPELALDLLAYSFAERWGGPLAVRTHETPIRPATETGFAPDPRLLGDEDGSEDEDAASEADRFDAFRAKGKKHRNAVLALALARSLKYSDRDPIFAKVEAETKAHIRQVGTPTAENFFGRVSADYLDALHLDLTGCDPQGSGFKAFKSQRKGRKRQEWNGCSPMPTISARGGSMPRRRLGLTSGCRIVSDSRTGAAWQRRPPLPVIRSPGGQDMTDFTAHDHPVLAVACPTCGAKASTWCHGPSGHMVPELHDSRRVEADRLFMEQHGEMAAIIHAASGWLIDPRGRARD